MDAAAASPLDEVACQHAVKRIPFPMSTPGRTDQIVWTFNRAGEFEFACLIAGHYQAGMVGRIVVRPA